MGLYGCEKRGYTLLNSLAGDSSGAFPCRVGEAAESAPRAFGLRERAEVVLCPSESCEQAVERGART